MLLHFTAMGRQESMKKLTDRVFDRAAEQFLLLDSNTGAMTAESGALLYPRSINKDGSLTVVTKEQDPHIGYYIK